MLTLTVVPKDGTDGKTAFLQIIQRFIGGGDLEPMYENVSICSYDTETLEMELDPTAHEQLIARVYNVLNANGFDEHQILDIVSSLKRNGITFMEE